MKIEFDQIDRENVHIIGIDAAGKKKIIGHIFTPSGTGHDCFNAIQVCGFREAFDLWGCGIFAQPKLKLDAEYVRDEKSGKRVYEYTKDIQLMFDEESTDADEEMPRGAWAHNCTGCFNEPCTCDRVEKYGNPYTVKREQDLKLLEKKDKQVRTKVRMLGNLEEKK